MEQIYIVKVRCEPPRSLLYPSERAYSSSTVGGLAAIHLILSLFGSLLLLPAVTYSGELAATCCLLLLGGIAACVTGGLASKLWYVDKYVRWFLFASSASVLSASLATFLVSLFVLRPAWRPFLETSSYTEDRVPMNREVFFHVFLSAFLEFLISLQSVRIAYEGTRNTKMLKSASPSQTLDGRGESDHKQGQQPPNYYADVVKELCRLQKNALLAEGGELGKNIVTSLYAAGDQRLPRPETHKEYKERMENFLSYNNDPDVTKD